MGAVQQLTGCPPSDLLAAQWQAHLHRPALYAAIDRKRRCVVVSIRGTMQLGDACTVLDACPVQATLCGTTGYVHAGFLAAARHMLPQVAAALSAAACTCPGWPVLITGHSLGGGVAAVLTMLLLEFRGQQAEEDGQEQGQERRQLGQLHCVGIGAAAAFCQDLGWACRQHVTSVLYGADCLPMFSILGARMLIADVYASSKAAEAVATLLHRTPHFSHHSYALTSTTSSSSCGSLWRSASTVSTYSSDAAATRLSCQAVCGSRGCRGLCTAGTLMGSAVDLAEIEVAATAGATATADGEPLTSGSLCGSRHVRQSSTTSIASTASIAAFAADTIGCDVSEEQPGSGLIPMYPPGRLLWMLPAAAPSSGGRASVGQLGMFEVDQTSLRRFLLTLETAAHHLPDAYIAALDSLGS